MKMKVVQVDKRILLGKTVGLIAIAAVFCTIWTALDPPLPAESLHLTQNTNGYGETIVSVSSYCDSESNIWFLLSFTFQGILLICASVLAYQMRSVPNVVNDSRELAVMIYSSFIFLVLRFVVYLIADASFSLQKVCFSLKTAI